MRENPIKLARKAQALSIDKLAALAALSRASVIKTEAGQLSKPPKELVDQLTGSTDDDLYVKYSEWRMEKRIEAGNMVKAYFKAERNEVPDTWVLFRTRVFGTKDAFCKAWCIQQQILDNFEAPTDGSISRTIPPYLREVLMYGLQDSLWVKVLVNLVESGGVHSRNEHSASSGRA